MSDVESGKILVADSRGLYVIKMFGDVRLTLCIAFDECIEKLFIRDDFKSILFDLSEVVNLDSTTLGLIAKVAVKCRSKKIEQPIIFCYDPAVRKLLVTMGIHEVCKIIEEHPRELSQSTAYEALPLSSGSENEEEVKNKVLESHEILMDLNENNRQTFRDLIETLKSA